MEYSKTGLYSATTGCWKCNAYSWLYTPPELNIGYPVYKSRDEWTQITKAWDMYSMSVTFFELIFNIHLWSGFPISEKMKVEKNVRRRILDSIRTKRFDSPDERLVEFFIKALDPIPKKRFPDWNSWFAEFQRALAKERWRLRSYIWVNDFDAYSA